MVEVRPANNMPKSISAPKVKKSAVQPLFFATTGNREGQKRSARDCSRPLEFDHRLWDMGHVKNDCHEIWEM